MLVGGMLRLEEEKAAGKPIRDEDIDRFKKSLAGPVAAMGDMLFMGNLKPFALTFAAMFAIYNLPIGLLAVLLLYNGIIIGCRLWGVYFGYARGWELVDSFSGSRFRSLLNVAESANAVAGGVLTGMIAHRFFGNDQTIAALGAVLAAVTLYLLKRNIPASWVAIILLPVCAFIALLTS